MSNKVFNVTSSNQSGGITAGEVHLGRPEREIDAALVDLLQTECRQGSKVRVVAAMGDPDAFLLARKIQDFLQSGGCTVVDHLSQAMFSSPLSGVVVAPDGDVREILVGHDS